MCSVLWGESKVDREEKKDNKQKAFISFNNSGAHMHTAFVAVMHRNLCR